MEKETEEEFKKIYENTYQMLLKFVVINCYNFDDVNDIVQDTYVEALNKIKKGIKIQNINSYLCGIAKNIIKRFYFGKKLKIVSNEEDIEIKDDINLEEEFITKENVKEIWEYVNKKDVLIAKIFYLYYVCDLKIYEIAEELNLTESTVKHKLYRTLDELKNKYRKDVKSNEK